MYTIKKPPTWLKNLPAGAIRIGVDVFNAVLKNSDDEEKARKASWSAIKARYEKGDDGNWTAKKASQGRERQETIRFQAARMVDEKGLVWEAVLIAPGLSLGYPRFYWSDELLEASTDVFKGVDVNAYELTADFFSHLSVPDLDTLENVKRFLTARKVGWIEKTWWEPGTGIMARINFLKEQSWLPGIIADGKSRGNDDVLGLSIDSRIKGFDIVVDEFTVIWVTKIVSCSSVDVVTRPAAGGKFLRAVAAINNNVKEDIMTREQLLDLIQKNRPELLKGKDRAALSDDEVIEMARMAMEKPADPPKTAKKDADKTKTDADPKAPDSRAAQGMTPEEVTAAIKKSAEEQEQRAACGRMLDTTLAASKLPDQAQARVRKSCEGKIFTKEELDGEIKGEKDYLASMSVPGFDPKIGDQTRVNVGIGTIERAQMAVDRAFGLTKDELVNFSKMIRLDNRPFFGDMRAAQDYDKFDDVPAFTGLHDMYVFFTGDKEVDGRFYKKNLPAELRASQDITSSTFSYVLGNTLGRRLVKEYRETNFQEDLLISMRKPVKDFRQQEAVLIGYFGDLDTVDPESGDYQEIGAITDEESTYTIAQKGNLLTITRKTIINDDLTVIQRTVSRLGRAARRTHAQYVWNFYINNSNCSDGTAFFTSGHGNLGATALSFATALVAYKALAKMTEKDSGKRIGLLDDPNMKPTLVYPVDLMETGEQVVNDDHYYATNDLTDKTRNPMKGKINGAMISLLTDTNDWGLLLPPAAIDMVEMGYLHGRQEPEMFVADSPQSEQVFVADKIRHKVRHEYAGAVVDYRSGYKAIVA
jgi:ChaB protein